MNIYELYNEMIEEKGNEKIDQHWCMVFADKITKEFEKQRKEQMDYRKLYFEILDNNQKLREEFYKLKQEKK